MKIVARTQNLLSIQYEVTHMFRDKTATEISTQLSGTQLSKDF